MPILESLTLLCTPRRVMAILFALDWAYVTVSLATEELSAAAAGAFDLVDAAWSGDFDCAEDSLRRLNLPAPVGVIMALF